MAAESGVTGVDPERAQSRGEHRHWEDPAPAQAELSLQVEDLAVGEDFGPPMSIVSPLVAGVAGASTRWRSASSTAIGWQRVDTHLGVIMMGSRSTR